MLFTAMTRAATAGLAIAIRARADKLVFTGAHHAELSVAGLQGFTVSLSNSDGPWGEPPLTDESCPLRRSMLSMARGNYSSVEPINQFDEKSLQYLSQRSSEYFDKVATTGQLPRDFLIETPVPAVKALRPVSFSLSQKDGGRAVRPETVIELNDNDIVTTNWPAASTSSGMAVSNKCPWQCSDNGAECSLMAAVCSLQAKRACTGPRCQKRLG